MIQLATNKWLASQQLVASQPVDFIQLVQCVWSLTQLNTIFYFSATQIRSCTNKYTGDDHMESQGSFHSFVFLCSEVSLFLLQYLKYYHKNRKTLYTGAKWSKFLHVGGIWNTFLLEYLHISKLYILRYSNTCIFAYLHTTRFAFLLVCFYKDC